MNIIPLRAIPSQRMSVLLDGQNCQINVYQKSTGLFLDLYVNNSPVALTVLCRDRNRLVRFAYRGFVGDLAFIDTQGRQDPEHSGLGDRYLLAYLEE